MKRDEVVFQWIEKERQRQLKGIELIASENFVSDEVMEAMGSCMTNKYAEGYPGKRYYGGCEIVDETERLAIERVCRLFGADMKTRGHGYILNMASLASWMPMPGIALYAATKAYLRSFSRSLWYEMRENGVTVTTVCPGAVATDLYKLSKRYQRLGLRLGVLMPPQRLADKALKAMFRGRKQIVPGAINLFFRWLIALLPDWLVLYAKKKLLKDDAKREA